MSKIEPVNEIDQLKRSAQKPLRKYELANTAINEQEKSDSKTEKPKSKKGFWGTLGAIALALFKSKSIFPLLKIGTFGPTLLSMLLMVVIYAKLFTWQFGIGFVLLLFVHEMGHYLSANFNNVNVSPPLFIPFVGAMIRMKKQPQNVATEAKIAIAGPLLGSLGALLCLLLYEASGQQIFLSLAYTGFLLNLFNLIPIYPLDGGRTVSAISPLFWLFGIPVCVLILFFYFNPILIIMLILGLIQLIDQIKKPNKTYYEVDTSARVQFAVLYFGLIILLTVGVTYIHGIQMNLIK